MTILVIEDSKITARLIESILTAKGYKVIVANSGASGLEKLRQNHDVELVITDLNMPGMSGLEVIDEMHLHVEFKNIPVIVCSGIHDKETVKEAAIKGCKHYLVKPFEADQLIQKVHEAIQDEKAILEDRKLVYKRLGIRPPLYITLIQDLAELVKQSIVLIEMTMRNNLPRNVNIDIGCLLEDSSTIGAHRVAEILVQISGFESGGDDKLLAELYLLLLRELKILRKEIQVNVLPKSQQT